MCGALQMRASEWPAGSCARNVWEGWRGGRDGCVSSGTPVPAQLLSCGLVTQLLLPGSTARWLSLPPCCPAALCDQGRPGADHQPSVGD